MTMREDARRSVEEGEQPTGAPTFGEDADTLNDNYPVVDNVESVGFDPSDQADEAGDATAGHPGSGTWGLGGTGYGRGTDTGGDAGRGTGTTPGNYGSGGSNEA